MTNLQQFLAKKLKGIVSFDEPTLLKLIDLFELKHYGKDHHYAKTGEYSKKMGLVTEGILRAYHKTENGEYYNKTFFAENSFVGAYSSLVSGQRNLINIQCLTNVTMLECTYADIVALYDDHQTVERLSRIIAEQYFIRKETREIQLVTLDASERYEIFRKNNPEIEQRIPQYHIASYLGITPTQLSRIRAQS